MSKEEIPGSRRGTHGFIQTSSRKKSKNRVDCQRSEKKKKKKSKTHKRLKERLLIRRNRTKRAIFLRKSSFSSYVQTTTTTTIEKQTINSAYLASDGRGRLAAEKGQETSRVSFVSFSFRQPPTDNWHKIS